MRLELKLAIFGIVLLLPKTYLYLSTSDVRPVTQAAFRAIDDREGRVAHWDSSSTTCLPVFVHSKQVRAAKVGQDGSDTMAVHAMAARGS